MMMMVMMNNFTKEVELNLTFLVLSDHISVLSDQNGDLVGYVLSRKKIYLFVALLSLWKTNKLNLWSQAYVLQWRCTVIIWRRQLWYTFLFSWGSGTSTLNFVVEIYIKLICFFLFVCLFLLLFNAAFQK